MKIRTRLTLQFILTMAGILSIFSVTILLVTDIHPDTDITTGMQESAVEITNQIVQRPGGLYAVSRQELDALAPSDIAVQVQDQNGKELASSTSWTAWNLPTRDQTAQGTRGNTRVMNLYRHAVIVGGHVQGYILIAQSANIPTKRSLLGVLIIAALINTVLGGLLVWLLVRRATRPLEHLAATASEIAEVSDHSLRLQPEGPRDEINRLAHTINGMLQSLEDGYQQVQAVNELQRQFLADISHELRTPLTIMLSSLDLLKKEGGTDPDFQASALENIRLEAERMARMVTQLLILARTDASATMTREPLLVVDIVDEAYRKAQPADSKLSLECHELDLLEDAVVLGNADYLKQLFLILLENAFKYTPAGGKVIVSGSLNEDTVAITVADTGIGITESDLALVFHRFYRAENARFRSGMGLGLSIAQSIVEQHGGKITLASTVGRGSRFTVLLPLLNRGDMGVMPASGEQAHTGK
ncbi:sensor histidine kinase [Ktedonobacter robiniae]|uniref:histidine kinase n=1 Tax=Ktedonobacter robiniae TaxID=2778365 RepID=A0ABQ3UP45_9CHLR|nr:HAMP domain-containing sensor histidine kinase [Ktedonobacter robiniae]GHO54451.1 two-component sensor histidine kinase [Ktedonobacter robiniae]